MVFYANCFISKNLQDAQNVSCICYYTSVQLTTHLLYIESDKLKIRFEEEEQEVIVFKRTDLGEITLRDYEILTGLNAGSARCLWPAGATTEHSPSPKERGEQAISVTPPVFGW